MRKRLKIDAEPVPRMGVAVMQITEQSHAGAYFAAEQFEPFRHGKVSLSSGILSVPPGLLDVMEDGSVDLSVRRSSHRPKDILPFTIPLEWMGPVLEAVEAYNATEFPQPPAHE